MKTTGSKTGEMSLKDMGNVLFLAITFFGGFYIANTELINQAIGQYVSPQNVGLVTAFVAYFFKQLMQDNTK